MQPNVAVEHSHIFWRLHESILRDRVQEVAEYLQGIGDRVQVVRGRYDSLAGDDAPRDPLPGEIGGIAITTIQEAKTGLQGRWKYPRMLFFDRESYHVSHWMPRIHLSVPVLNRRCLFVPIGMVQHLEFVAQFGHSLFVRPNSGLKPFTGFPIDCRKENIKSWFRLAQYLDPARPDSYAGIAGLDPSTMICISQHKELETTEWRFWIIDRKVVASTPYGWSGTGHPWQEPPPGALNIATQMANNKWQPDLAYVVDVVQTAEDGLFWLNEINAASTSGWYSARLDDLIPALRHAVVQQTRDEE